MITHVKVYQEWKISHIQLEEDVKCTTLVSFFLKLELFSGPPQQVLNVTSLADTSVV